MGCHVYRRKKRGSEKVTLEFKIPILATAAKVCEKPCSIEVSALATKISRLLCKGGYAVSFSIFYRQYQFNYDRALFAQVALENDPNT
jgi:hypothetical protein